MSNVTLPAIGSGSVNPVVSSQTVTVDTSEVQDVALALVSGGVRTRISAANPLPVTVGTVTVTGGLTDAQLRATPVPVSGTVAVTGTFFQATQPVSIAATVAVSGPLTDTQLRATPVPVSGTVTTTGLTDVQLRATPVPVSGTVAVTGTFWQATQPVSGTVSVSGSVAVTGPLTDAQLRASAVPVSFAGLPATLGQKTMANSLAVVIASDQSTLAVSGTVAVTGPLTDAQLRATPVPISGTVTANVGTGTQAVSGTVTANVGTGPWPVTDNAGSLTVDAPVSTPVFVRLSDGSAAISTLPVSLASVPSHAVTNAGTFAVQVSSSTLPTGASTETTLASILTTAGGVADAAATGAGSMNAHLRSIATALAGTITVTGGGGGVQYVEDTASAGGETVTLAGAVRQDVLSPSTTTDGDFAWLKVNADGALYVSSAGGGGGLTDAELRATPVPMSVSGSVAVTGTFWQATQPVSGTVTTTPPANASTNVAQIAGTATNVNTGNAGAGTQRVVLATDQPAVAVSLASVPSHAVTNAGTFAVQVSSSTLPTGAATETTLAAANTVLGATGDAAATGAGTINAHLRSIAAALAGTITVTGGGGGAQFAEDSAHTTGDLGTQLLAVRTDTAAARATTDGDYIPLITDNTGRLWVNGSGVTQPVSGTVAVSGSVAVTGTFWQATQPVSGTVTANAGTGTFAISAAALPLPAGASTAAKQPALGTAGTASSDVISVQGIAAMTPLLVNASGFTQPVSGTVAVSGSVAVTGPLTDAQLRATAVPVSGTVTANIGTSGSLALDASVTGLQVAQASATSGQKGALAFGATTTAAPTYTTAQSNPLSLTTTGLLRVDGSGVTQPVSGTVAVSGSVAVTGTFWQATQPVSGTVAVSGSVAVTGPLTDAQLRATAVPVSGTVTTTPPSNASTNVAQINGVTPLMGAGNTGTGSPRVTIATDQVSIPTANTQAAAGTATLANISGATSSTTLIAANTARLGFVIINDSTSILYVKFGSTASATSYVYQLPGTVSGVPYTLESTSFPRYTGIITGIWVAATGTARCTELTA